MNTDPQNLPKISVVIVSYNVRNLLESCLYSLFVAAQGVACEVIVVDNRSDDGSAEMVETRFPSVRLIRNPTNAGYAKANNIALTEAKGEYLLLLNPDTIVQEDTLQVMLGFFAEHPEVGIAGCKTIKPDGSFDLACRRGFPSPWVSFTKLTGLSALFPRSHLFARYNLTYLDEDATYEVDAVSGSFLMLRRKVYETIGGLDEDYFMYGEDLDWCYRTQKAGWKVHYVGSTKIIHYKGESAKRTSIDTKAVFYQAMELFVEKNLKLSAISRVLVRFAIKLRLLAARSGRPLAALVPVILDVITVAAAITFGEYLKSGKIFSLPSYGYPEAYIVPIVVMLLSLVVTGTYSGRESDGIRSAAGVLIGFFMISSLTFFFKEYAFSRAIVLYASAANLVLIPGRRFLMMLIDPVRRANLITGKPTLLVGRNDYAMEIAARLKKQEGNNYRIVGIIDTDRRHIGERLGGFEVLGSVEAIGKIIRERNITDVIFSPDVLPYSDILSLIGKNREHRVHYRLVPKSMEYIVGKANIDQLTGVPLVDVEYNLGRSANRTAKRLLDIVLSLPLLIAAGPFVFLFSTYGTSKRCSFAAFVRRLPKVLAGSLSLVGPPEEVVQRHPEPYLGKPGLTGLAQLRNIDLLSEEEIVTLTLQYVRNHSIFLDLEILLRSVLLCLARKGR